MMFGRRSLLAALGAGLVLSGGQALACGCPKEAMLKLHGTVSMVPPNLQPDDLQQGSLQQVPPAPAIDPLLPAAAEAGTPPAAPVAAPIPAPVQ